LDFYQLTLQKSGQPPISKSDTARHGEVVVLYFSYEELQALRAGASALLDGRVVAAAPAVVMTTPENLVQVEQILPLLQGDMSVATLVDMRNVQSAVSTVVDYLRIEMESTVLETHAADEAAVSAYFDFAYGLAVANRIHEMAAEMEGVIELATGAGSSVKTAETFQFPD